MFAIVGVRNESRQRFKTRSPKESNRVGSFAYVLQATPIMAQNNNKDLSYT